MTPATWNFGSNWSGWSENADFQLIFWRSTSAITPSEKSSVNTNRKSTMCSPMSLRWTLYIACNPPNVGSETRNSRFPCKIALHLKTVCYKVSFCEYSGKSYKAFTVLSIRAKIVRGGRPLPRENLSETDPPSWKTPIFNWFLLAAPQL